MPERVLRLFVSSPGDVEAERRLVGFVVERLNGEFAGRVRIEAIRWETEYYSAHATFQKQIPEAADCDIVVAIFRARLGTRLPEDFPRPRTGEPYPSGTAYEVLSAIEARQSGRDLPDIYVFRYPETPSVSLDAQNRAEIEAQWAQLKGFFDRWFRSEAGDFLAAFQEYRSTEEFARQVEACLRQFLAKRGFLAKGPVWDRLRRGSPFPGLAAFGADRESIFFGRDLAIAQSVERLRRAGRAPERLPFLLIIGASGVGKSSLLQAGLLPRLTLPGAVPEIDLWRTSLVVPGADPFRALAESLLTETALGPELGRGAFPTAALLARQLAGAADLALAPIRAALSEAAETRRRDAGFASPRPARLALAIDQAERLFMEADPATADAFADLLGALARSGLAYVVMVLRSDAYARFQSFATLVALRESGATFDLVPPNAGELEAIVTGPVEACDPKLEFETEAGVSLAGRLVADAKGGDALALLQITLTRLYTGAAARGDGVLRFAEYHGMGEAVTATAEEALAGVPPESRAELPALVAALVADVAIDPVSRAPMPVIASLDPHEFAAQNPARAALVEAFVARHLLTSEGDGGSVRIRPTHEALLRIWPEAVALVSELGPLIRIRHTLDPIVREWEGAAEADKPRHLDISPALLAGAQQLESRLDLPHAMGTFITQSTAAATARAEREREAQERRVRDAEALAAANRRTARFAGAGLAAALLLAGLAVWQWRTAQTETSEAQAQRDRAEHTVTLATDAANSLIFDLAEKFHNRPDVPAATVITYILDRAIKLLEALVSSGETRPALRRSQAEGLLGMADSQLTVGQLGSAVAAAKHAREILQTLATEQPESTDFRRELFVAYTKIGEVLEVQGDLAEALESYRDSLTIRARLAEADQGNAGWQRDLSVSYEKVGDVLVAQGNLAEALKSYRDSLTIRARLAEADQGNAGWQRDLSVSYAKLADVSQRMGRAADALAALRQGQAIMTRLTKLSPDNAHWRQDLAWFDGQIARATK